jgi:hypothetical protein
MPVLDAKALKTDPKGAAFLLSVLRQRRAVKPCLKDALKPSPANIPASIDEAVRPDTLLQDSVTGV